MGGCRCEVWILYQTDGRPDWRKQKNKAKATARAKLEEQSRDECRSKTKPGWYMTWPPS